MPWYYAGPEAKPVGPVSSEQLQTLLAGGTITPETFVIEHTGAVAANLAWKRYREVFPATPAVPSLPPPPPPATAPYPAPHSPYPPAASAPAAYPPGVPVTPPGTYPAAYPQIRPANGLCAWGFGLSLVGFCFAFACGIGAIPALISIVLCIIGLVQVSKRPEQSGHGLAIFGLVIAGVALLIGMALLALWVPPLLKSHGLTVTEQTSNDSE